MKTIVFYGSPRKQGNTKDLLDEALSVLEGEVKLVDCYKADIAPCIDCKFCYKKKGCSIKDDMQEIYDYIDECDAVIIATPMQFGIISAPMHKVFSRLQTYWSNDFVRKVQADKPKKKYGALLVTSGTSWMNMERLIEGVTEFAFGHMQAECVGTAYAKRTDQHPAKDNKKAVRQAKYLACRLNELCSCPSE
ncbi:MAG: flavodoxin family protein [Lachnospiraceae bacterium]